MGQCSTDEVVSDLAHLLRRKPEQIKLEDTLVGHTTQIGVVLKDLRQRVQRRSGVTLFTDDQFAMWCQNPRRDLCSLTVGQLVAGMQNQH